MTRKTAWINLVRPNALPSLGADSFASEGEANVFKLAYEHDLESDTESVEAEPELERRRSVSPVARKQSARETWELLRQRGKMNRQVRLNISVPEKSGSLTTQKDQAVEIQELDREIGYAGAGFGGRLHHADDVEMFEAEEESQFSISKAIRTTTTSVVLNDDPVSPSSRQTFLG